MAEDCIYDQRCDDTPGKNVKRYLTGALNARTDKLIHIFGRRKNSDFFILWLQMMLKVYNRARFIHIILDNYTIRKLKKLLLFKRQLGKELNYIFTTPLTK